MQRVGEIGNLRFCLVGEGDLLCVNLLRGADKVDRVVAQTFKITDGMQQPRDTARVRVRERLAGQTHQKCPELVLVFVEGVFVGKDLVGNFFGIVAAEIDRRADGRAGELRHLAGHVACLVDRHGGLVEQTLVEESALFVLFRGTDDEIRDFFELLGKRNQECGGKEVENRMHKRDAKAVDRQGGKGEVENRVKPEEAEQADGRADEVEGNMHDGNLFCILADADGGDERRHAGADVLTHNDGNGDAVADLSRHGKRLQHGDRGGGGLDDARDNRTEDNAQNCTDDRLLQKPDNI